MMIRRWFDWPSVSPWGWRNPFAEMEALRKEMDRLFGEVSGEPFWTPMAGVFPMVNITEDKENFYVRAEMPGIEIGDIDISVTGNTLSIKGERKRSAENEKVQYHRKEREVGTFQRLVSLSKEIDPNKAEAKASNGILTVILPKAEKEKMRQIPVKTS